MQSLADRDAPAARKERLPAGGGQGVVRKKSFPSTLMELFQRRVEVGGHVANKAPRTTELRIASANAQAGHWHELQYVLIVADNINRFSLLGCRKQIRQPGGALASSSVTWVILRTFPTENVRLTYCWFPGLVIA